MGGGGTVEWRRGGEGHKRVGEGGEGREGKMEKDGEGEDIGWPLPISNILFKKVYTPILYLPTNASHQKSIYLDSPFFSIWQYSK